MADDINKRRLRITIKWVTYACILITAFVFQTTPGFLSIAGTKPMLCVSAAIGLAMYLEELPAACVGAFSGLLCDLSSGRIEGFNAIILLSGCLFCSLMVTGLMQRSVFSSITLGAVVISVRELLDFFFSFIIWGHEGTYMLFITRVVPTMVYTLLFIPLCFKLFGVLENRFRSFIYKT